MIGFRGDADTWYARLALSAPRVPWDVFLREHFRWTRGEHLALLGPTGQGKTFLLRELLKQHPYVVAIATKPGDATMDKLSRRGYDVLRKWRSISARDMPRRILWPDATQLDSLQNQRKVIHDALGAIYREGGWTVAIDELWYLTNVLKLETDVRVMLLQGRSLKLSLLCASQRPAFIPLEVYDQSSHLFFYRDNDDVNLSRLKGMNASAGRVVRDIVMNLEQFQVLYINTRDARMVRTRVPGYPE